MKYSGDIPEQRALPDGYTYCDVTKADIQQINDEWESIRAKLPGSKEYLTACLEHNPSTGIRYNDFLLYSFFICIIFLLLLFYF